MIFEIGLYEKFARRKIIMHKKDRSVDTKTTPKSVWHEKPGCIKSFTAKIKSLLGKTKRCFYKNGIPTLY